MAFKNISCRTSTKKKTLNPKWNEELEVHVSPYLHKQIQLNVFDENRITRYTLGNNLFETSNSKKFFLSQTLF